MFNRFTKEDDQIDEAGVNLPMKYQPNRLDQLCKITNFTKHEIRMLYQGFKQQCPGGEVDEHTFLAIFSQFFPQGDASKYAHYVFQSVKKSSGKKQCLSFEDLVVMLSRISRGTTNEKISFIFQLYDQNFDNYISKNEMLAITQAIYDMLGESTIPIVKNSSAQEHVDAIFDQIDEDHDGLITLTDLTNWCQKVFLQEDRSKIREKI